jgi:hypothetical protein
MKEIKYTILYCVFVRPFVMPFYYGSGTVINYGSSSDFLTSSGSGSGSTRQKERFLRFRFRNTVIKAFPMISVNDPSNLAGRS